MRLVLLCLLLGACAAPPLALYTLGTPPASSTASAIRKTQLVVAVARVTIPEELDTADIVVREGSMLRRSPLGRWASRLSSGVTDRLTERLGQRYPSVLVTDRPLTDTPAARVQVNIARLDISAAGAAVLDADWIVVPRNSGQPARRDRAHLSATGPVATDQDVVTLVGGLLDRLAGAIDLSGLR